MEYISVTEKTPHEGQIVFCAMSKNPIAPHKALYRFGKFWQKNGSAAYNNVTLKELQNHWIDLFPSHWRSLDEDLKPNSINITINHIEGIIKLSKYSERKLRRLNKEQDRLYIGKELTKPQLIFQLVFLMDAFYE
jgi:hypothetical protein